MFGRELRFYTNKWVFRWQNFKRKKVSFHKFGWKFVKKILSFNQTWHFRSKIQKYGGLETQKQRGLWVTEHQWREGGRGQLPHRPPKTAGVPLPENFSKSQEKLTSEKKLNWRRKKNSKLKKYIDFHLINACYLKILFMSLFYEFMTLSLVLKSFIARTATCQTMHNLQTPERIRYPSLFHDLSCLICPIFSPNTVQI